MSKFGIKNIWDIQGGGGSVNTTNLAKKNEDNTFTSKNTFKNTGDILTIQTTDNNSGGVDFKQQDNTRIGYLGGSQNTPNKMTLWGKNGLILQANGQNVEVNSGAGALTYTSSNTSKDRQEVMVRNDFYYVKKANTGRFDIPTNGYQTVEFTINGLTTGLNEFIIRLFDATIDISYEVKIQCNNLNYPNHSDIRKISKSNWIRDNLDQYSIVEMGWVIYDNNKMRFRAKALSGSGTFFNGLEIYQRIPAKLVNS